MITYPPAKINIGLNIVKKRDDGFHDLKSLFYPISFTDILEINHSNKFDFNVTGLKIPGDANKNLIVKAYQLLDSKFKLGPVNIHLHKQIPMGAGLGGGSANGAFALSMFNDLFELNISKEDLIKFAAILGSDCPFFILNQPAFVEGRGEKLTAIDFSLKGYYIKLINPGIHISTKEAFEGIDISSSNLSLDLFKNIKVEEFKDVIKNDFERTLFPKYESIAAIKNDLYKEGAIYASMTGTGSSVYGLFANKPLGTSNYVEFIDQL